MWLLHYCVHTYVHIMCSYCRYMFICIRSIMYVILDTSYLYIVLYCRCHMVRCSLYNAYNMFYTTVNSLSAPVTPSLPRFFAHRTHRCTSRQGGCAVCGWSQYALTGHLRLTPPPHWAPATVLGQCFWCTTYIIWTMHSSFINCAPHVRMVWYVCIYVCESIVKLAMVGVLCVGFQPCRTLVGCMTETSSFRRQSGADHRHTVLTMHPHYTAHISCYFCVDF